MFFPVPYLTIVILFQPSALAVLADGSYAPSLDKPEQAFDLLQEAMTMSQLEWKTHLLLAVNINASCGYDPVGFIRFIQLVPTC